MNYSETTFVSDLTLALHNGKMSKTEVKKWMSKLHLFKHFSIVVPRKFLRHIQCAYNTKEIPEGSSHPECDTTAYEVYAQTDTVMCFKPR